MLKPEIRSRTKYHGLPGNYCYFVSSCVELSRWENGVPEADCLIRNVSCQPSRSANFCPGRPPPATSRRSGSQDAAVEPSPAPPLTDTSSHDVPSIVLPPPRVSRLSRITAVSRVEASAPQSHRSPHKAYRLLPAPDFLWGRQFSPRRRRRLWADRPTR